MAFMDIVFEGITSILSEEFSPRSYLLSFSAILHSQRQIAMISEMIHTASLIHDDVIDASKMRRGKPSVQNQWGQRKVKYTNWRSEH